ncbi:MAG: thioredoxin domain-containing protein, partial [Anaerolineales bacterium]|nr:thioredoxin domain-containing protein [Anaerolineales bacterium]
MSKKQTRRRRSSTKQEPNWTLIGGIVGLGALILIALLVVSVLQNDPSDTATASTENAGTLIDYCLRNEDRCVSLGAEDAPVSMVEVSDYGCIHCHDFVLTKSATLQEQFVQSDQLRWFVMPFALNERTQPSAAAFLCAAEQGSEKAFVFHEGMFEIQNSTIAHTPEGFSQVAAEADLDVESFDQCVEDGRYLSTVAQNQRAAAEIGINSTPSFVIGDTLLRGNLPLSDFADTIESY